MTACEHHTHIQIYIERAHTERERDYNKRERQRDVHPCPSSSWYPSRETSALLGLALALAGDEYLPASRTFASAHLGGTVASPTALELVECAPPE
jgi:hypothetical protein